MTNNIKKIFSFLTICIIFGISVCETEKDIVEKENNSHFKISEQTFKELLLKKDFNEAFSKMVKSKKIITTSKEGKTVMEDQYGFTIADQSIKVIESESRISYTLLITRENQENNYFENLIIDTDSINQTKAIIAKYTPSEPISNNLNFKGTLTFSPIVYNSEVSSTNKMVYSCVTIIWCKCQDTGQNYCAGRICGFGSSQYCSSYDDSSGRGGSSSTTGGTGGGGSSTTTSTTTTSATVIPPVTDTDLAAPTPCESITSKTIGTTFLNKFNAINDQQHYNLPYETGFSEKLVNGKIQYTDGIPNGNTSLTIPNDASGYVHVHNNHIFTYSDGTTFDGGVKILSPADLAKLITTCRTSSISSGQTALGAYGINTSNDGIFALTIIDGNIDMAAANAKWAEFVKKYNDKAEKILNDTSLSQIDRSKKLQEMLLKQIELLGLKDKVGLFEGKVMPSLIGNKITWSRKTLDNNKKLIETPC